MIGMTLGEMMGGEPVELEDLTPKRPELDVKVKKAIHHMLWVWFQYGRGTDRDGRVLLEHRCMQAGESATDFIEALGLGSDNGYELELNDAGLAIFHDETLSD